jgi:putative ABC transport system permease protein
VPGRAERRIRRVGAATALATAGAHDCTARGLAQDLRGALRLARRTPGVTVAAVLALALGIGANTAIFSVVDGVLLRPLPFPDSQALYRVFVGNTRSPDSKIDDPLSFPQYQDVVTQARASWRWRWPAWACTA